MDRRYDLSRPPGDFGETPSLEDETLWSLTK
jgi:hypothetical protein